MTAILLALLFAPAPVYGGDPVPGAAIVVGREHVPESVDTSYTSTHSLCAGHTTRAALHRKPERWILRVEQCRFLHADEPCTFTVEAVDVTRAQWDASTFGDAYMTVTDWGFWE